MVRGPVGRAVRDPGHRTPRVEAAAEPVDLRAGPLREPHARDAAREPQVVADHRARTGLAPDRLGLHDDRLQSLGRRIDGGGEAGGTGADDDDVGDLVDGDRVVTAVHGLGRLADRRVAEELVAEGVHDRKDGVRAGCLQNGSPLVGVGQMEPRRHPRALQPVAQGRHVGVRAVEDQLDARDHRPRDRPAPVGQRLHQRGVELLVAQTPRDAEVRLEVVLQRGDAQIVGVGGAGRRDELVIAGVALELAQQRGAVLVGDEQDDATLTHGSHRSARGRGVRRTGAACIRW